jgi:hypothetical protein
MDHALTRRGLLAGMGAAAGVAAFGSGIGTAGAAPSRAVGAGLDPAADTLVPGLTYVVVDGSAFTPRDGDSSWPRNVVTQGTNLTSGGTLVAPLVVPVGAVLKQVTLYYLFPPGADLQASVQRKPFVGAYDALAPPATLPTGAALQSFTWDVTETVNGTATYAVFVNTLDTTQLVGGLRYGYTPPATAFVPLAAITRVLDTRVAGGKLTPGEERTVTLGLPAGSRAGVINLTVTETEAAGFVAVFPAGTTYAGNSSINWFGPNQNLANGVIATVDAAGKITIRGGVNKTHVVIDVQGYLS